MKKVLLTLSLTISLFNHTTQPESVNCLKTHPHVVNWAAGMFLAGLTVTGHGIWTMYKARNNNAIIEMRKKGQGLAIAGTVAGLTALQAICMLCLPNQHS